MAILPKSLSSHHEEEFKGIVIDIHKSSIALVSSQEELIALKDEILSGDKELTSGDTYIGVINGIIGKAGHVSVRFLNGIQKLIKVKDLNTTQDYKKIYTPGKVIRVAVNKLGRLCTKQKVIEACHDVQKDK